MLWYVAVATLIDYAAAVKQHPSVVYAINAGGAKVVDRDLGIVYESDLDSEGKSSVPGVSANIAMPIDRAPDTYQTVFQTERYALESFGYTVPTPDDGDYTLVLRFSEVYWTRPGGKIFDVKLDNSVDVVTDLDIYAVAGRGVAHDELVEFSIVNSNLVHGDHTHAVGDTFTVDFVKAKADNPKVCAILLVKGSKKDALALAPLEELGSAEANAPEVDVDEYNDDEDEGDFADEYGGETDDLSSDGDANGENDDEAEDDQSGVPIIPVIFAILAAFGIGQIRNQQN